MNTYLDMDGVLCNWSKAACEVCGVDYNDPAIRAAIKASKHISDTEPAILPGNILVVDVHAGHEKEGPYYHHRLTLRLSFTGERPHLELLKARKIPCDGPENPYTGADYDPDLNAFYKRLRARLDENGRVALKKEEEDWIRFRDSQPADARDQLTQRRAVELRARAEN